MEFHAGDRVRVIEPIGYTLTKLNYGDLGTVTDALGEYDG